MKPGLRGQISAFRKPLGDSAVARRSIPPNSESRRPRNAPLRPELRASRAIFKPIESVLGPELITVWLQVRFLPGLSAFPSLRRIARNLRGFSRVQWTDVRSLLPGEAARASILASSLWAPQTRSWRISDPRRGPRGDPQGRCRTARAGPTRLKSCSSPVHPNASHAEPREESCMPARVAQSVMHRPFCDGHHTAEDHVARLMGDVERHAKDGNSQWCLA